MSKNYTLNGIGQNVEFGKNGKRIRDNTAAGPAGDRMEMRNAADSAFVRCAGLDAVDANDFITFAQFQAGQSGLKWIAPVTANADSNLAITGNPGAIDGATIADGDRVVLTGQTNPIENGVWLVNFGGAWTRPTDFNTGDSASNRTMMVQEGSTYADTQWTVTTDLPSDIIDTDPLALVQIAGPGTGVTSLTSVGTGQTLISGGPTGAISIFSLIEGSGGGVALVGSDIEISAPIAGNTAAGTQNLVIQNNTATAGGTLLRDVVDTASVTWTLDGNGNLEATATPATAGLPYDTIYYVSLTGSAANNGLDVNLPTDIATALTNANAAGNAMVALMDQGTYNPGGPVTITGDNVSIVSMVQSKTNGTPPVTINAALNVNAIGFTSRGINWADVVTVNSSGSDYQSSTFGGGASIANPSNNSTLFDDCDFGANDLSVTGAAAGFSIIEVRNCTASGGGISLGHSGAGSLAVAVEGGTQFTGGVSFGQSSSGGTTVVAQAIGSIGPVVFSASGTGDTTFTANGCDAVGQLTLNNTSTGTNTFNLASVRSFSGVTATALAGTFAFTFSNVGVSNNVDLGTATGTAFFQSCVVQGGAGTIDIGAGYTFQVSDTAFNRGASVLGGTETTANSGYTSDFSSAKIQAQTTAEPNTPILVLNPNDDNHVESVPFSTFQQALSAGQGINPTQLAGNTVQTADPIESTQTAGVELTLYRPFTGVAAPTTITVGAVPANAVITGTKLLISSAATSGNANLGYNGGTGTELQDGATDNNIAAVDTYETSDLVQSGAQTIELDITAILGTVSGLVKVTYFVAA